MYGYPYMYNMMGYGGFGFGWIFDIFWLIIIIIVVVALVRFLRHHRGGDYHRFWEKSGIQILEERYAKGEITRDEFVKMKNDLKDNLKE